MGIDIAGIGAVADLAGKLVDRFFPNKTEEEKAQLSLILTTMQQQTEINKAEAMSPSVFVSGWRPFIGWVCGTACAWNWLGLPVGRFIFAIFGHKLELASADLSEMFPLLLGMLGLAGYRTVEKFKGVASK